MAFPKIKEYIVLKLKQNSNLQFSNLIAQNVWLSEGVVFSGFCIIYSGCSINYGSVLKDFIDINMNCALGHHSFIDDYLA